MIHHFRVIWRLSGVALWLMIGSILALMLLRVDALQAYRPFQIQLIRWWAKGLLRIVGVRLSVHGQIQHASVWVANHVSWLDIIVLMAIAPSRFLSKAEVAHWPVIGWLARRAGTVFMRRGGGETERIVQQLSLLAQQGDRVVFFPEGTSYAHRPGHFHARLFSLPLAIHACIQPIALMYHDDKEYPRQDVAYVGEQTFMQNLLHLLRQTNLVAQVSLRAVLSSEGQTRDALSCQTACSIQEGWQAMQGWHSCAESPLYR